MKKLFCFLISCCILFSTFGISFADDKYPFWDTDHHPAKDIILELVNKNILKEHSEGMFRPKNPMTICDFIEGVLKCKNIEIPKGNIKPEEIIAFAIKNGLINEVQFEKANDYISIGEAVSIVIKGININEIAFIKDANKKNLDTKDYFKLAKDLGLISWELNNENVDLTRAEAAVILSKFIKINNFLNEIDKSEREINEKLITKDHLNIDDFYIVDGKILPKDYDIDLNLAKQFTDAASILLNDDYSVDMVLDKFSMSIEYFYKQNKNREKICFIIEQGGFFTPEKLEDCITLIIPEQRRYCKEQKYALEKKLQDAITCFFEAEDGEYIYNYVMNIYNNDNEKKFDLESENIEIFKEKMEWPRTVVDLINGSSGKSNGDAQYFYINIKNNN